MEIFKLNEEIKFNGQERIFIDTNSEKNILEIARKNNNIKNKYKELLRNDYVLSLHKDNISHFCKRNKVS